MTDAADEEPRLEIRARRRTTTLSGWGRLRSSAARVVAVQTDTSVGDAITKASTGIIPRGLGRAYGDAATLQGGTVIAATGLRDLGPIEVRGTIATIDVGGGVSLGEIMRIASPSGWIPPVLPGTRHVTIGGAIAADIHGKNHHLSGGFGATVRGFRLLTADGESLHVDRETDRALFEATVGGMGLTGVVTSAQIELAPLSTPYVAAEYQQAHDFDEVVTQLAEGDRTHRFSVAWIDLATPARRGRGIVQHGDIASPRFVEVSGGRRMPRSRPAIPAPPVPGKGLVHPAVIQAFNSLYWMQPRRSPALASLGGFFHPLDAISNWPRLYGRSGLLQYQFVVPDGAEDTLWHLVERFTRGPVTPALAVLKRLGPTGEGMLSFPLAGWTLAVDLPASSPAVYSMLDEMDEAVTTAGGRVYLAKDARLRPEFLQAMYPRLDEWRAVKDRIDPNHQFRSDLAERLGLVRERGA